MVIGKHGQVGMYKLGYSYNLSTRFYRQLTYECGLAINGMRHSLPWFALPLEIVGGRNPCTVTKHETNLPRENQVAQVH